MTTSESEKQDKVLYHRSFRRANKQAVHRGAEVMPHFREHSNPYNWAKDGWQFFDPHDAHWTMWMK